ncbi:hypothetical protein PTSG_05017 [Salpingoeca rosetta]|uniref:AIMP2 thioredoxin-like domain-containing protein n=1 Tax=Salpingoeca rosetta (strain ATCC 50818 / BSB-021) TaxID=946362 RepID=F2U999_SALR5|nr:uncharacterized protein PTSG_05017 [Salpingoeca rosetta]EGD73302.1 hypothetical protein PTSG_05017 [Salpingoeca rosetta]|eukprot:XP_004994333.1 hypothetical protein PTSG_05017 [Salpingoeca rosetta]
MGSMYKADAMYQEPQPPVTDVMYRMDPLINVPSTEQGQQPKLPNDRRGRLYQRQMKNLANLQHLLTMTNSLLGVGPTGAAPTAPSAAKQGKHGQVQPGADQAAKIKGMSVVVRCKPSNPPYATLLLVEQLKAQGLNVCTPQFWHSSLGAAPDSFKPTGPCASADCDLRLTIIWANDVINL